MDVLALLSPLTAPADSTLRHFLKNICQLSLWTTKKIAQQGLYPLLTKPVESC